MIVGVVDNDTVDIDNGTDKLVIINDDDDIREISQR